MVEEWKKVNRFEFIEVSNMGNVRNTGGYMKMIIRSGYPNIIAQKNVLEKILFSPIHLLVADLFLNRKEEQRKHKEKNLKHTLCVCHRDDNPFNNKLSNLYLGDEMTNAEDKKRNKGRKEEIMLEFLSEVTGKKPKTIMQYFFRHKLQVTDKNAILNYLDLCKKKK